MKKIKYDIIRNGRKHRTIEIVAPKGIWFYKTLETKIKQIIPSATINHSKKEIYC